MLNMLQPFKCCGTGISQNIIGKIYQNAFNFNYSGNTVTLVVKRRVSNLNMIGSPNHSHQHSHSLVSSTGLGGAAPTQQTIKLVLNKSSKKDDFGLVLGCRLFVKVS